ncbi:hypothetical protein GCM10022223_47330 [Kineosporia mesophila]|uniref:Barstar (barnase inhibitor) domain-containing protein n=1 Tax=Kineosporia mesophila TaxID=566012 RepID=A0ABP7A4G5_9ACTN|nr:hypothetical protein [Kineosporia mesophila]MCD5353836.1 hypothetical protein [Kineosporia mesophila]
MIFKRFVGPDWVQVESLIPQLEARPYLCDDDDRQKISEKLSNLGFIVAHVEIESDTSFTEEILLRKVAEALHWPEASGTNWNSHCSLLYQTLTQWEEPPIAVLIQGMDGILRRDIHAFTRSIHLLEASTHAVRLSVEHAARQFLYVFSGNWSPA